MDPIECKVIQQWINQNLAVCEPSASSSSSACLSLMGVWILHGGKQEINHTGAQSNSGTCYSHRLTASLLSPRRLDPRFRASRTNALFRISLCSISFFFPHPLFFSLSFLSLRFAARENKMFSENEIRNITFQVLSGLVFVHKHGKRLPPNILSLCSVVFVLR